MLDVFFTWLTDYTDFPPRRFCGPWETWEWVLAMTCEYFIGFCYLLIPALFYGLHRNSTLGAYFLSKDPKHVGSGLLISSLFIASCGITHLIHGIIFHIPIYSIYLVASVCCALINVWNILLLIHYGALKGLFKQLPDAV